MATPAELAVIAAARAVAEAHRESGVLLELADAIAGLDAEELAGQPPAAAAARAQVAAEQLPTVGNWPGSSPSAEPPWDRIVIVDEAPSVSEIQRAGRELRPWPGGC